MIIPSFIDKFLLNKVELSAIDLEQRIISLGLMVESYGVINSETNKLFLKVEDDRETIVNIISDFLTTKKSDEIVEVFWSNFNKYSIVCDIEFVIENISNIFDEDWDFWIIQRDNQWVVENYHEEILSIYVII
ncbi:hypothetical protein GCM10025882_18770 [Acinetobacter gyllenbergii]|uniref:Uncharacterized protein n=1 Tax=Acinetobacter gyllenbergii CIP 110306 = MTCC 11365 TaxID=1217657 RepID=A0A829HBN0_9GAMM|nr:hypothetical protein [Acinetobacter gyllenbergii]EPF69467.1 hypothetical protein F957_04038 [Acinetobacter gyllenbergii CIP 110306 = MTCC 11365]ESK44013.1 hypothetical protein F987_01967 [Acinetobacter gyllenbergii NIPH 230]GMA11452.1 hypothetical protein GCM10025882_18770 [Acinetobacter gyllenbergii]